MPWRNWEDHQAGLYASKGIDLDRVQLSLDLLTDCDMFYEAGKEMLREWRHAATHNLKHMVSGRRSWLGQATCCYVHQSTSAETRVAWGQMTNSEQRSANATANALIDQWERGRLDAQTLFGY